MFTHFFRLSHRGAADRHRSRLLEGLLARAAPAASSGNWRADAFGVLAPTSPMPGIGAAAFCAAGGKSDGAVFLATPVHCVADMNNVRLPLDGMLTLSAAEASELCADFNRTWADGGVRLVAGGAGDLFCLFDGVIAVDTVDPEDMLGRSIVDKLPTGPDASRLRRLMTEIEMWLFEHPVNRARQAAAAPTATALWLWGGGRALDSLPPVEGWTAGDDPMFKAWAAAPESPGRRQGSAVFVIAAEPGTENWRDAESRWLAPSVAELGAGRIARIELSAGHRRFTVGKGKLWRFLRRRPWWESFA